jgi:hypothetical protein
MLHTLAALLAFATVQPPPLQGPAVTPRLQRPSLVSYDMQNRLRPLESSPEHEAFRLLTLDAATRDTVEGLFAARAARIDAFVVDHLMEFGQLDTAGKAGAKLDATILLGRLLESAWPLITEPLLRERIAAALPAEAATQFRALIAEYRRAWWKQARADARAKGDNPPTILVAIAERAVDLGTEVGRSYERQAASGTLIADYLLAGVTLTEPQQQLLRDLKLDMLRRTNYKPTEKDQQLLVLGILAHLPQSERAKIIKKIANR